MRKLARALTLATLLGCSGGTEPTRPRIPPNVPPPNPPKPQNKPPVITSTPTITVDENSPYIYQIQANDPEGQPINCIFTKSPSWLGISGACLISGTAPEVPKDTSYEIGISVADGSNETFQNYTLTNKNVFNRYVLTESQLNNAQVSDSNLVFPTAQTFLTNDILAAGITSKTSEGLLRKVISVSSDKRTVRTAQASLEEVIKKTSISLQKPLIPSDVQGSSMAQGAALNTTTANAEGFNFGVSLKNVVLYDRDGNPGTIEDRLIANGNINFNLDLLLDFRVENHAIDYLKFQQKIKQSSDITVGSNITGIAAIIDVKVAEYSFSPLVLGFIPAPIPIIVKPKIGIYASINPTKVNPLSVNIKQITDVTSGLEFSNGSWKNLGNHETTFDFSFLAPVQGDWDLNFSAGPRLEAKVYGVVGPSASLNARLRLSSQNNNWKLYGGLFSVLGVDAKIFGRNIAAYAGKVLDYEKLLAEKDTTQQPSLSKILVVSGPEFILSSEDYPQIYSIKDDGSSLQKLTNLPYNNFSDYDPSASPDGKKIALVLNKDGNKEIYTINSDGSGLTRLTFNSDSISNNDYYPNWSSDGKELVFVSNRSKNIQNKSDEIYLMNSDGTNQRKFPNIPSNLTHHGSPRWSSDDQKIAFDARSGGDVDIYTIKKDGTNLTRLTNTAGLDLQPSWSHDSKKIAFVSLKDGNREIYTMNADGSEKKRLTNNVEIDTEPYWLPNGKIVFISSRNGGYLNLHIMNADGTDQKKIKTKDFFNDRTPKHIIQ